MKRIPQEEFLKIISTMLENHKKETEEKFLVINKKIRVINNCLRDADKTESREIFENITKGRVKTIQIETLTRNDPKILDEIVPNLMQLCQKYKIKQITAYYE
ncbi:MAG: hypothetical protein PHG24_03095 [Candidatus Pacebacteria bacterium]|jgi:hypothetical protein|nr:hypothetical protein [Candidatus Paceibacterota bacterium]MDD4662243.1 hypothetical protein [Candidatus Paceibacterota bacterium]